MYRRIVSKSLTVTLLTGCAGGALVEEGTGRGWAGDEDGEIVDEPGETGEVDESGESGGEDPDPEDATPVDRVTWMGEVDGDLWIRATLGEETAQAYPGGSWEIRLDAADATLYAQIVDPQGIMLELVRVRRDDPHMYPAQDEVLSFCFPYPFVPQVEANCSASPCPWAEAWPWQGAWPDCFELSSFGALVNVVGGIDGTSVGHELAQGMAPVDIYGANLGDDERAQLDAAARLGDDLASLLPAVEDLDDACLECMLGGSSVAARGLDCTRDLGGACTEAYWGTQWHQENCDSVCSP